MSSLVQSNLIYVAPFYNKSAKGTYIQYSKVKTPQYSGNPQWAIRERGERKKERRDHGEQTGQNANYEKEYTKGNDIQYLYINKSGVKTGEVQRKCSVFHGKSSQQPGSIAA